MDTWPDGSAADEKTNGLTDTHIEAGDIIVEASHGGARGEHRPTPIDSTGDRAQEKPLHNWSEEGKYIGSHAGVLSRYQRW